MHDLLKRHHLYDFRQSRPLTLLAGFFKDLFPPLQPGRQSIGPGFGHRAFGNKGQPVGDAELAEMSQQAIFLGSIGAILSGAIFGDHCSPISDTTVMSSIASGADHIDHVRTQLPYGLLVGGVTMAFGYIPAGFGMNPWVSNLVSLGLLALVIWRFGKDPERESVSSG